MRALVRLAGTGVAGIMLFYAGTLNGALIRFPHPLGGALLATVVGWSLLILLWVLLGTGRRDAGAAASPGVRRALRVLWLALCASALAGLAMLIGVLAPPPPDSTPHHNDAVAIGECAARLVLDGRDPYASLDLFSCYERLGIGPDRTTPLRRGLFRDVEIYPDDAQLAAAWEARRRDPASNVEFEARPSYPALSLLVFAPWVALGLDLTALALLLLLSAMALVLIRAERGLRPFVLTASLASLSGIASVVGGTTDLLYALPLLAAWLWRERRWSGVALGLAVSAKQLAWFAAPYYLIAVLHSHGGREAARRAGLAVAVFAIVNAPFALPDPAAWTSGLVAPALEPMFPRGVGIVALAANRTMELPPQAVFVALEAIAFAGGLVVAWLLRRSAPEVGVVLAYLPLYFAWRSLFSYFFLLPLLAAGAIARLPMGALEPGRAASVGAVGLVERSGRRTTA